MDIGSILAGSAVVIAQLGTTYVLIMKSRADVREARESRRQLQSHLTTQDTTLADSHALIKQVKVETNGMKTELVAEVRAASFKAGVKSETDKVHETAKRFIPLHASQPEGIPQPEWPPKNDRG